MQGQCPSTVSGAMVPDRVIPRPSPSTVAMFHNINRNSSLFLQAVGIKEGSKEHKELKATIQALYRKHMNPFKYVEEHAPHCVDQLIAKTQLSLPWLDKYEDAWPARIYLKRYVDTRRPHLRCTRYAHAKEITAQKSQASLKVPTRNLEDPDDMLRDHGSIVREFLGSLTPNLEHHLDAFVELGVKDQKTLQALLSWPQVIQAQFIDEGRGVLQLTSLEKQALLMGFGLLTQRALRGSLAGIVKPGCFHP